MTVDDIGGMEQFFDKDAQIPVALEDVFLKAATLGLWNVPKIASYLADNYSPLECRRVMRDLERHIGTLQELYAEMKVLDD